MEPLASLAAFRGTHRLLLVLAPAVQSPAYESQMLQFTDTDEARAARDLLIAQVLFEGASRVGKQALGEADATALRAHFGVEDDGFLAVLIGKDGTEKERYDAPVAAAAVFEAIDAMPMRQREMREDDDGEAGDA